MPMWLVATSSAARPVEPDDRAILNWAVPFEMADCRRKIQNDDIAATVPYDWGTYIMAEDEETVKLIVSIMYVESRFRPESISKSAAYGLMQMTRVAMLEAADYCDLPIVGMDKLLDPVQNIRYGSCYLNYLMDELDNDLTEVLIVFNGGYRQLIKYKVGSSMAGETANYVLAVRRAYNICSEEN